VGREYINFYKFLLPYGTIRYISQRFNNNVKYNLFLKTFYRVSENTTAASNGRLNNPEDAWCFHVDKIVGQRVTFAVDLGSVHLISGFQSQGPPRARHPVEYLRYVGLEIQHSLDGYKWEDCCNGVRMPVSFDPLSVKSGGNSNIFFLQFYADDRRDKSDVIHTHSFSTVVPARHVRIVASTDVRWIGEAEKCFRFEILGCSPDTIIPEVNFSAIARPAGYLEAVWSQPQLIIAEAEVVTLPSRHFLVNASHIEDDLVLHQFNVSDNNLILPRPLWDTTYTFDLDCAVHEDIDHLDCGRFEVKAIIEKADEKCMANLPGCPIDERVQFLVPQTLSAMSMINGSVAVMWTDSDMGWKTAKRRVKVLDEDDKVIKTTVSKKNMKQLQVADLQADQSYKLIFSPEGPNIPNYIQEFSTTLAICKYSHMDLFLKD
jgi:hypothetical protein